MLGCGSGAAQRIKHENLVYLHIGFLIILNFGFIDEFLLNRGH